MVKLLSSGRSKTRVERFYLLRSWIWSETYFNKSGLNYSYSSIVQDEKGEKVNFISH